jgi:hypothetical protein
MQTIKLYRFTRPDGGVTVSPVKPETDCTELFRLVADDGMVLTDGVNYSACTDTENPGAWSEVPDTENPGEATAEDYQNALREMGVEV